MAGNVPRVGLAGAALPPSSTTRYPPLQVHCRNSPFHYYGGGESLRVGFQVGYLLVLAAVAAALVAAATVAFERRDVGV